MDGDLKQEDNETLHTHNIPEVNVGDTDEVPPDPIKAQDYHTMIAAILESYIELERTGFEWDLPYKERFTRFSLCCFVPL